MSIDRLCKRHPAFKNWRYSYIAFSVGWFGAILPYLALDIAGLTTHDAQVVHAACLAMELIGWYVIVPLSIAAFLSSLAQSLFTQDQVRDRAEVDGSTHR